MKSKWLTLITVCSVVATLTATAFADFEPLFQVIDITGDCSLQRPQEDSSSPAESNKAYPYGTKIITGKRSALTISFSEGNICRILANANVSVDEDKSNAKLKIIRINKGEVEVELQEDFHKNGDELNVETATATCSAIGCKFRVASKAEEDLQVVVIRVIEGMIRVFGENFSAATLDENDWLSLLSPADRSFLRLKTMKGEFDVAIKDEEMQDKTIPTTEGTVLKIWQRFVPETGQRVVTVVLTAPDGTLIETFTVTYNADTPTVKPEEDSGLKPTPNKEAPSNPVVKPKEPRSNDNDPDIPKDPITPPTPTPVGKF